MSDKPIVTIIGAGRSGRGMLGEMFIRRKITALYLPI